MAITIKALSKDADNLVCLLYKNYLEKRKKGSTKQAAKSLGGISNMHDFLSSYFSEEDLLDTCKELDRAGYLQCNYASNTIYLSFLTDEAIIYMENRFSDGLNQVLETIAKIKNIIPFI